MLELYIIYEQYLISLIIIVKIITLSLINALMRYKILKIVSVGFKF